MPFSPIFADVTQSTLAIQTETAPFKTIGLERIAKARDNKKPRLLELFTQVGLAYPPREIFLRAFKQEAVLELWAREEVSNAYQLIAIYPILASSGQPGPKKMEGDLQVPEGFYFINRFNPESRFHLSLGLNYPNTSDLIVADPEHPGGDIFIHGNAVSVGCLPIGDSAMEELFLIAIDTATRGQVDIPVDIFPARMSGTKWELFAREPIKRDPGLKEFWDKLARGYAIFESTHRLLEKTPRARH